MEGIWRKIEIDSKGDQNIFYKVLKNFRNGKKKQLIEVKDG